MAAPLFFAPLLTSFTASTSGHWITNTPFEAFLSFTLDCIIRYGVSGLTISARWKLWSFTLTFGGYGVSQISQSSLV